MSTDPLEHHLNIPADFGVRALGQLLAKHTLARAQKVFKLENSGVVVRQVLLLVPRRCAETFEAAVFLNNNENCL